jgi:hypothetical protein
VRHTAIAEQLPATAGVFGIDLEQHPHQAVAVASMECMFGANLEFDAFRIEKFLGSVDFSDVRGYEDCFETS